MYWLVKRDKYIIVSGQRPANTLRKWPKDIDPSDLQYCLIGAAPDYEITLDQGLKAQGDAIKQATENLRQTYEAMNKKVESDSAAIFGTTNQLSALRQYLTFLRMAQRPELYDNEGLRALFNVGTISRGDNLNTVVKIKEYAEGMLAQVDQFSIQAQKEVQAFLDEKESVTGVW